MCTAKDHIVLSEGENAQITWCKGCKGYSLILNNCCMSFKKDDLKSFRGLLLNLKERDYQYNFLGNHCALIKHHCNDIGISLTREDTAQLQYQIEEALTVQEAFGIIYE